MGGRKRNRPARTPYPTHYLPSQKESSILTIQGRQIIQLLLGLRRQTLVFQKLSLNNLALNVSTGKQESNAREQTNQTQPHQNGN